jgi:hypothetical protein
MEELRTHPECRAIRRVIITRPVTQSWGVTLKKDYLLSYSPACRKIVEATVQQLQARYDLKLD